MPLQYIEPRPFKRNGETPLFGNLAVWFITNLR